MAKTLCVVPAKKAKLVLAMVTVVVLNTGGAVVRMSLLTTQ